MCSHRYRHARRHAGIAITTLEVKVESDSDAYGLVGIADAPTTFGNLRMSVKIGAEGVDAAQLRELAAWGEAHSPVSCTLPARPSVAFDVAVV